MNDTPISVYKLNGQALAPLDVSPPQLTDMAAARPGIYTILRTYHHDKVLGFDRHLARLEESAQLADIPLHIDHTRLRNAVRCCVDEFGNGDARLCISVPTDQPDTYYLAIETLIPVPDAARRDGVRVYTLHARREAPRVKSTEWVAIRAGMIDALPQDAYEGILIGSGNTLLEGTRSNFYAVLNGCLRTAGDGVLSGTARAALLEVAPAVLPVRLEPIGLSDLPQISEAMLTSSSRGVVPISHIDGRPVGTGRPGLIVQALSGRYDAWAEARLESL